MATTSAASVSVVLSEALLRGEYCCVVAPGAVSPLVRAQAAARLREASLGGAGDTPIAPCAPGEARGESTAIVVLNLATVGPCSGSEEWYERLLSQLGPQLGLSEELAAFWRTEMPGGPLQRWIAALQEIVLPSVMRDAPSVMRDRQRPLDVEPPSRITDHASRLVIFVEAVETVRDLPFSADEFISAIRECYNRRPRDPAFDRLTFCLLSPVPIACLIRDSSTTWFNIGRRIEVVECGDAVGDAPEQGGRCRRSWASTLLQRARDWICGEPYSWIGPLFSARPAARCG
jgi:hypothetical protein